MRVDINDWTRPVPEYYKVVQGKIVPVYPEPETLFNPGSLVRTRQPLNKLFPDSRGTWNYIRLEQGAEGHIISRLPAAGLVKVHFPGQTGPVTIRHFDGRRSGCLGVYCQPQELELVG